MEILLAVIGITVIAMMLPGFEVFAEIEHILQFGVELQQRVSQQQTV